MLLRFAVTSFALIKIDIEGSEQDLFDGTTGWMERTNAMMIEFHPTVDQLRIIAVASSRIKTNTLALAAL